MDRMIQDGIHPDDVKKLEEIKTFFSVHPQLQSIRKRRFACRIFSPTEMEYWPYKVTVLRMNTDNPSQNLLLIIFHKEKENIVELTNSDQDDPDPLDLSHLMCCVLRCRSDENLTILNGARSLFALTGYDVAEIETQFHNSLLNMIHPDDQWVLTVLTRQFTQESGKIQTEFRMLQKNHAPIWVLCNTRSYLRKNGIEYFYHSLTDITSVKETQTNLASTVLHHQLILDHLSSIVFEWDLAKDTLICTDKWEKRFGYPPTSQEFHLQLERATHFHPDDLPFIRQKAESMLKGKKQEEMDVRILDHNGNYIWNKICANTLFDDKGCPTYIIGEITDIDELKKAALSMREQAETDALTKLFNKASTQRLISSHLSESHAQETDCLLLLDLDNFKTVNDSYGHMYGDTLLTQVGNTLRKMFRSCDIIGRVGGDEFMVFIKDIPSLDSIQTRCQLLLDAFRELLQNLMPDLNVSCSIGAALIPEHGSTYTELYQHADEALYDAKTSGKDQYKIYHPPVKNETISK
jgi:putative two-component system response regulator